MFHFGSSLSATFSRYSLVRISSLVILLFKSSTLVFHILLIFSVWLHSQQCSVFISPSLPHNQHLLSRSDCLQLHGILIICNLVGSICLDCFRVVSLRYFFISYSSSFTVLALLFDYSLTRSRDESTKGILSTFNNADHVIEINQSDQSP